jgi:hypothetical protein
MVCLRNISVDTLHKGDTDDDDDDDDDNNNNNNGFLCNKTPTTLRNLKVHYLQPVTSPNPKPNEPSPTLPPSFLTFHFNILPSIYKPYKRFISTGFPTINVVSRFSCVPNVQRIPPSSIWLSSKYLARGTNYEFHNIIIIIIIIPIKSTMKMHMKHRRHIRKLRSKQKLSSERIPRWMAASVGLHNQLIVIHRKIPVTRFLGKLYQLMCIKQQLVTATLFLKSAVFDNHRI